MNKAAERFIARPVNFCDLLIIDEMVPCTSSPFRTIEYSHYLKFFNAVLLSTEGWANFSGKSFDEFKGEALPDIADQILRFAQAHQIPARLAYVTFLGNAKLLFGYIENKGIPFILQLYPGGQFAIDQEESDFFLAAIIRSPLLRKIIVTQTITRDYLINKLLCDPGKIEFIYGGVFESRGDFDFYRDKKFSHNKETVDICFVAYKYGSDVNSKGFLDFIAIANILAAQFPMLKCHVVGNYTAEDADLGGILDITTFYGPQQSSFFPQFYARMDVIISINRAFTLAPGAFDGFPTGACIEAGLHGVINALSDPLKLNCEFTDGDDFLLMEGSLQQQASKIASLLSDAPRLENMSYANWKTFRRVFDTNAQLWRRTKIISDELTRHEGIVINHINRRSDLDRGPIWNSPAFTPLVPTFWQKSRWARRHPLRFSRGLVSRFKRTLWNRT